jgi:hypothetical protein
MPLQFQQTNTTWEVAAFILTSPSPSPSLSFEVKFFSAQILKRKVLH